MRSQGDKLVMVAARISVEERAAIERLARENDRTPSREVGRAIRAYLADVGRADRLLRERAEKAI